MEKMILICLETVSYTHLAAVYRLKKKIEPLYAYYVIQNYITSVTYPKQQIVLKFSIKEQRDATILSENMFLQDKASLEQHFEALYNLAIDMNQYIYSYEKPFCWSEYIKDPNTCLLYTSKKSFIF